MYERSANITEEHLNQWAEYPGIVPYAQSRILCNRELGLEEKSVRGVLVKGLTHTDMIVLDLFEGPVSSLVYLQPFYMISLTTGVRAEMCQRAPARCTGKVVRTPIRRGVTHQDQTTSATCSHGPRAYVGCGDICVQEF
jgi:hypothetical protein